jgi:hypothetical protein
LAKSKNKMTYITNKKYIPVGINIFNIIDLFQYKVAYDKIYNIVKKIKLNK